MDQVAHALFTAIRQMDEEAGPNKKGSPTGLNWYGGYAKPEQKRPQTEPCWTQRLAQLLPKMGISCRAEVNYPGLPKGRKNRCDLVISLDGENELWLEIKGAWKSYWEKEGGLRIYRSYLFHPLLPGLVEKSHTAANDLRKLEQLKAQDAQSLGLLLVGFAAQDSLMDVDVEEFIQLAELLPPKWYQWQDSWDDVHRIGERVQCWLWVQRR